MLKKRKKIIIFGIVLFTLILVIIFLNKQRLGGMPLDKNLNKSTQLKKNQQAAINYFLNSSDADLQAIASSTSQNLIPESTAISKIENKFHTHKIDIDIYLKLKVLAVFAPLKLPAEFQSSTHSRLEGDRILAEIEDYYPQLDKQTKEFLDPFLLPPDEPGSFFNPQTNKEKIVNQLIANLN